MNFIKTATSQDVAKLAGVSQSAVSRCFTKGASISSRTILRERFGDNVKLKFITKKKGFISGIFQSSLSPLVKNVINEIENTSHWKRFGL